MSNIPELFGSLVFNDTVQQKRLPHDTYRRLRQIVASGEPLTPDVADVIANVMKAWALDHGVTHFTHWFQPMTGITAEKHDSFLTPAGDGVIMEFSGRELIKGEPDASSFPSGGLRATFEARGYTAWDPTSPAFIKDDCLYIPTAFCSYTGEALDKKTPLLRSMHALNREAVRFLRAMGWADVTAVTPTVGAEQEYFLIPKELYEQRRDLRYTGRTLFGAMAPKGQELDDHYFGTIKPRVMAYMKELDEELWRRGVMAKTEHNEVAPAQHELAPFFTTTNIAADGNQLTMELMQRLAQKHGMVCLLAEKPFAGVNGSGKHNNWSLATDTGINLFEPGETPYENAQFLLFLCAVIRAVDEYQDLLRISVASAGNDHRLGALEAPPAVISMFLGDELTDILEAIKTESPYGGKEKELLKVGVHTLPRFPKDTTDRNRTSPFAFTGNKFEFRMLGSAASIAEANTVLNTTVAQALCDFADKLENETDFEGALHALIRRVILQHGRILFNGNGYDEAWVAEAKRRGLLNLKTTADALPYLLKEKNIALFEKHKVFSRDELCARYEIYTELYCKTLSIEANTMQEMMRREILPAVMQFTSALAASAAQKRAAFGADVPLAYEQESCKKLSALLAQGQRAADRLDALIEQCRTLADTTEQAAFYRDEILPQMEHMRSVADEMEVLVGKEAWPFPTYGDLLFSVR